MTYEIKQTETGHFAVMYMWPLEIARFGSPTHARLFVERVLREEAEPKETEGGMIAALVAADDRRAAEAFTQGIEPPEAWFDPAAPFFWSSEVVCSIKTTQSLAQYVRDLARSMRDDVEQSSAVDIRERNMAAAAAAADAWEQALARVAAGEGCKAVAEDMGLSFPSLRARWANRKRQEAPAAEPEVKPAAENGQDTRSAFANLPVPVRDVPMPARRAAGGTLALPDEVEDVRGRPDLVARHQPVWTDEIDMEVIEAGDDEEKLWRIAAETGASIERVKRRQTLLMEQIAKEIGR